MAPARPRSDRDDRVPAMLYPIGAVAVTFVLLTVLNINLARWTLSFFFDDIY